MSSSQTSSSSSGITTSTTSTTTTTTTTRREKTHRPTHQKLTKKADSAREEAVSSSHSSRRSSKQIQDSSSSVGSSGDQNPPATKLGLRLWEKKQEKKAEKKKAQVSQEGGPVSCIIQSAPTNDTTAALTAQQSAECGLAASIPVNSASTIQQGVHQLLSLLGTDRVMFNDVVNSLIDAAREQGEPPPLHPLPPPIDPRTSSATTSAILKTLKSKTFPPSGFAKKASHLPEGLHAHFPATKTDLTVHLYTDVFYSFMQKPTLSREDYEFTSLMIEAMSMPHQSESSRRDTFNLLLSKFLKRTCAPKKIGEHSSSSTDGSFSTSCHGKETFLLIQESKKDKGHGGANSLLEVIAYYIQNLDSDLCENSCCPCLLLEVFGATLFISGACFGEYGVIVDPLCSPINMVFMQSKNMMMEVANAFVALRTCTLALEQHYLRLETPHFNLVQPRFPFINSFEDLDTHKQFAVTYLKRLYPGKAKPIFLVQKTSERTKLIIKFAERYCLEAHRDLAASGAAPKVLAFAEINPVWKVIVMEYLEMQPISNKAQAKEQLLVAMTNFHKHFVHGDLREANILPCGTKYAVMDFDWAGPQGVANYPPFMNHNSISWPTGAEEGKPITMEHDHFWLAALFATHCCT
ncbi:Aldose 1-epimerase [Pelomyxa schiedti]|nr:Aldose 1-epimerase [Pelomyxa schiedti]